MNLRFTHLLLAFALLIAQAMTGAHAIEHASNSEKDLPPHVCQLCLAAHDLGSALPGAAFSLPVVEQAIIAFNQSFHDRSALPAPQPRQQAPPHL